MTANLIMGKVMGSNCAVSISPETKFNKKLISIHFKDLMRALIIERGKRKRLPIFSIL